MLLEGEEESQGSTPLTLELPRSQAEVRLRLRLAEYADRTLPLQPDRDQAFEVVLEPLPKKNPGAHRPKPARSYLKLSD